MILKRYDILTWDMLSVDVITCSIVIQITGARSKSCCLIKRNIFKDER